MLSLQGTWSSNRISNKDPKHPHCPISSAHMNQIEKLRVLFRTIRSFETYEPSFLTSLWNWWNRFNFKRNKYISSSQKIRESSTEHDGCVPDGVNRFRDPKCDDLFVELDIMLEPQSFFFTFLLDHDRERGKEQCWWFSPVCFQPITSHYDIENWQMALTSFLSVPFLLLLCTIRYN